MKVTVHVSPDVADQLQRESVQSPAANELMDAARELGVQLRPMHPGATDQALRSTFVVEAKDPEHAQQVVSRFQALSAAKAAYIKPAPEMP